MKFLIRILNANANAQAVTDRKVRKVKSSLPGISFFLYQKKLKKEDIRGENEFLLVITTWRWPPSLK